MRGAFDALGEPVRSQHLKVLLEASLVSVRASGTCRLYALDRKGLDAAQTWLTGLTDPLGPFAQPQAACPPDDQDSQTA